MRTICICSTKGGTGKSTLATALAVLASVSKNVALLDFDSGQSSVTAWYTLRSKRKLNGPRLVRFDEDSSLSILLRRLRHSHYDLVFIDSPPSIDTTEILEGVVEVADYILSPCRPSLFDTIGAKALYELAEDVPLGFVLTDVTPEWDRMNGQAAKVLGKFKGAHLFKSILSHRHAYVESLALGKTGAETDDVAKAEVEALWGEIQAWMS